jgi:hypothetical protein
MMRFKPRHEPWTFIAGHFTKADEGAHLMNIASDRFRTLFQFDHIRVRRNFQQMRFVMRESPKHEIQQSQRDSSR